MPIRLPDFTKSAILNELRRKMNAPLIPFSLEIRHVGRLTYAELEKLATEGIEISFDQIEILQDGTFSFGGVRILAYIVEPSGEDLPKYHLLDCQTMQYMRSINYAERYIATNRTDGLFKVNRLLQTGTRSMQTIPLSVCKNCLKTLGWKNYSHSLKAKTKEKLVAGFNAAEYFAQSPRIFHNAPTRKIESALKNSYTDNFDEISAMLRKEAGWRCQNQICARFLAGAQYRQFLHVHHLNGNKGDNRKENLQVLCIECHAKANPFHAKLRSDPRYILFKKIFPD